MLLIRTVQNIHLSRDDAAYIAERLTNTASEFQKEMWDLVAYHNGRHRAHGMPHVMMAVVYRTDEQSGEPQLVGWGATRMWRGVQTYECFFSPEHRGKGLARAALACLVADGWMDRSREVAVFSVAAERLAKSAHFHIVRRYQRDAAGEWTQQVGELPESASVVVIGTDTAAHCEGAQSGESSM